jgi:hypothetical protein
MDTRDYKLELYGKDEENPIFRFIAHSSPTLERFEYKAVGDLRHSLTGTIDRLLAGKASEPHYSTPEELKTDWSRLIELRTSCEPTLNWTTLNIPSLRTIVAPEASLDLIPETPHLEVLECRNLSGYRWQQEDDSEYWKQNTTRQYGFDVRARFPRLHTLRLHYSLMSYGTDGDRVFMKRVFQAPHVTTLSIRRHSVANWDLIVHLFPHVRHLGLGPEPSHRTDRHYSRRDRGWWPALLQNLARFKCLASFDLLDDLAMTSGELQQLLKVLPSTVTRLGIDAASADWATHAHCVGQSPDHCTCRLRSKLAIVTATA